jgi:hypothetical protein
VTFTPLAGVPLISISKLESTRGLCKDPGLTTKRLVTSGFAQVGLKNIALNAFGILLSFSNLAVSKKSYGQTSFGNSIFPTAQMQGR